MASDSAKPDESGEFLHAPQPSPADGYPTPPARHPTVPFARHGPNSDTQANNAMLVTVHISTLYPRPDLEFPERRVLLHPQRDTLLIGRQSRTRPDRAPEPDNGLFNSPVMSREHAKITADLSAKV